MAEVDAAETLGGVQGVRVGVADFIQPGLVVKPGRVYNRMCRRPSGVE